MSPSPHIPTWQLRARFAAALSAKYGAEVPAYTTLVAVSAAVDSDHINSHPESQRLGSLERITAERHGAIPAGTPRELREVAILFAAFGIHPVGFYDLRGAASPVPVVSTAFRPITPEGLARNPFRVFTSLLTTAGPAVLLRQTSFRTLAEPRRFRHPDGTVRDGTLRVRFGEVEARGVALTPKGRRHYDAVMAAPDPRLRSGMNLLDPYALYQKALYQKAASCPP